MSAPPTGVTTTLRDRRRVQTRHEIRRAALDLFEKQGFEETTVEQIARSAGISPRTYFRHCAAKEDSILGDMHGFDTAVAACIRDALASDRTMADFTLADVEAAFRSVMDLFGDEQSEIAATVLRIRTLVCVNPALATAALGRSAEISRRWMALLPQDIPATARSHVRMILDVAQLTLSYAFDEWVNACAGDVPGADLTEIYRAACRRVRSL